MRHSGWSSIISTYPSLGKSKIIISALTVVALLAGCETTSTRPYTPSTENIIAAQNVLASTGKKVRVGRFAPAAGVDTSLTCRALGQLDVAPGKSPLDYIRSAFQDEMFAAGAVDPSGLEISGTITQLEFGSFGTGKWNVGLNLKSASLPQGLDVKVEYSFKTSYSALRACQNVVDAFQPTVSELISKAIAHPDFRRLVGA